MDRYICIKGFQIPYFDENMNQTDEYGEVEKDSIWNISTEISESDIRMYKDGGMSDFDYIDITKEHLEENFVQLKEV